MPWNPSISPPPGLSQDRTLTTLSAIDGLSKEVQILKSLYYASMRERHNRTVEAHCRTFGWIFETETLPNHNPRSNIKLTTWLKSKDGLFWVSGKPGSGKSTFMKWLAQEHKTIEALCQWAGPADLCTASFFFWISGYTMQKSQIELLKVSDARDS